MIEKPKTQRYKAGIIFLIPFIVLLASTFSFYIGYSPEGRTNNGSLIDPPLSFSDLKLNEIEKDGMTTLQRQHAIEYAVKSAVNARSKSDK